MTNEFSKIDYDREILSRAQERGSLSTLGAYFRLSGPGWLQSAITLGGGSLGSALYLGVLGGTSMLWLQLLAIVVGVIMLSAISYVTLSTGERPYEAINEHINPVLGVGWITATILANMIWIMPQFSLCFDVMDKNLSGGTLKNDFQTQVMVSGGLFAVAAILILLNAKGGFLTRVFDGFLKIIVGVIVICFVGVVVVLFRKGEIGADVFQGFIPDFEQWWKPTSSMSETIAAVPEERQAMWTEKLTATQRSTMISTAATAVGINMTFLLPYSMLNRGWDRPFRGLSRFDLITGMAIPYLMVTSCIVIASAFAFHNQADEKLLGDDPAIVMTSPMFGSIAGNISSDATKPKDKKDEDGNSDEPASPPSQEYAAVIIASVQLDEAMAKEAAALKIHASENTTENEAALKQAKSETAAYKKVRDTSVAKYLTTLTEEERKLYVSMVKPNSAQLAKSLEPLLGEKNANLVFGIGALGMGFSTIIILMMINGFAFRELMGKPDNQMIGVVGALLAGVIGLTWPWVWAGESKTWVIILASLFGAMLLPIAYFTFMIMMNSRSLLGDDKPTGIRMGVWNILMTFGVLAAVGNAYLAVSGRVKGPYGEYILGAIGCFVLLAIIGFSARSFNQRKSYE